MTTMTRREALQVGGLVAANVIVLPYIPKGLNRGLYLLSTFGVQIEEFQPLDKIKWLHPGSLVRFRIKWDEIELSPDVYTWSSLLDQVNNQVKSAGCYLMFNIICTPKFYSSGVARCCPPKPEYVYKLVNFINAVVRRYDPAVVEFWNEPEIYPDDVLALGWDDLMGGFGLSNAPYYGEIVKEIGKSFTDNWFTTNLVVGSLMLSDGGAFWNVAKQYCPDCYDAVSFHSYCNFPSIYYDGPRDKANLLRRIGENKPLILSETALLSEYDSQAFRLAQSNYFKYQADQQFSNGISSILWYTLATNLYKNSDLVVYDIPQPAWYIYNSLQ